MINTRIILAGLAIMLLWSCGGGEQAKDVPTPKNNSGEGGTFAPKKSDPATYDPRRGEGKFQNMELPNVLDKAMAEKGDKLQGVKCASCHKLSDERLVGPGWAGVTNRRSPEWIMNFITNPDPMIEKDPELQAQLELCLVRMPNQSLTDDDARNILEFMRQNDGLK